MSNVLKRSLKRLYFSKRVNSFAVSAFSAMRPPPYRRENMEFEYDVWNGICSFHSSAGRQIGENNTVPELYKEMIPTEHRICKFDDSRNGLPINVTALREVMAVWDDVLQFATLARNDYIARRKLDSTRLNLRQAYVFSKLGAGLAAYEARRAASPLPDGQLPPLETAFFTLGVGPFMVVRALMEQGDLTPLDPNPLTAQRMYELADSSGSIISPYSGKGCAGSKRLFLELLDVVMNGSYSKPLDSAEARRALAAIGDLDAFYAYIHSSSRLELLIKVYQQLCAHVLRGLRSATPALSREEQGMVEAALTTCGYVQAPHMDARQAIRNCIKVMFALLEEHDYPEAEKAVRRAGLLDDESAASLERTAAAARLQRAAEVLHPLCAEQLALMHQALGQSRSHSITLDDLMTRGCGHQFKKLLGSLQA